MVHHQHPLTILCQKRKLKMPQLKLTSTRQRAILSSNKWRYLVDYRLVYDSVKLSKEEIVTLCCHTMHCVRIKHMEYGENDGLYAKDGSREGQDAAFMRCWLHYFVMEVYKTTSNVLVSTTLQKRIKILICGLLS